MIERFIQLVFCMLTFAGCGPMEPPLPPMGAVMDCTTKSGVPVHTWRGGPTCVETEVWLREAKTDWERISGKPCPYDDFDLTYKKEVIMLDGRPALGVYWRGTEHAAVWHDADRPHWTPWTVRHEFGHHCITKQHPDFSSDKQHCLMCISTFMPCTDYLQNACKRLVDSPDEEGTEGAME